MSPQFQDTVPLPAKLLPDGGRADRRNQQGKAGRSGHGGHRLWPWIDAPAAPTPTRRSAAAPRLFDMLRG